MTEQKTERKTEQMTEKISGFLNIYKPQDFTSHDAVAVLRRRLPRKTKVGHTGTLDPQATGVLPICVGKATRLAEYFKPMYKVYLAEMTLGAATDTYDVWGKVTAEAEPGALANISGEDVLAVLPEFTGVIDQVPPMTSAVKINGQKLYQLAHKGIEVERPARRVEIRAIEVVAMDLPRVNLKITCSGGTYVRSLCHDIGAKLGVGGYMSALERQAVGDFTLDNAVELRAAEQMLIDGDYSALLPLDVAIGHLPRVDLQDERDYQHIMHGREVVLGLSEAEAPAVSVWYNGELLGIGETRYEAQGCACNEMLILKIDKLLAERVD